MSENSVSTLGELYIMQYGDAAMGYEMGEITSAQYDKAYRSLCGYVKTLEKAINNGRVENINLLARAKRAEQVVERLIVAIELGNDVPLIHEPEITSVQSWYKKMHALVAEWKGNKK